MSLGRCGILPLINYKICAIASWQNMEDTSLEYLPHDIYIYITRKLTHLIFWYTELNLNLYFVNLTSLILYCTNL